MQHYLHFVKSPPASSDFSIVGIIDGSGSMGEIWPDLCKAWNYFITGAKSAYCIQFEGFAQLQGDPRLEHHLAGDSTKISTGFLELSKLVKSNQLSKNVGIVFITDGFGEDDINSQFLEAIEQDFNHFHKEGYQFKLFTVAYGEDFSSQIAAQLKNLIHNSTFASSLIEVVENPKVDFQRRLQDIREEVFFNLVKVDPGAQLAPFTKATSRVAGNQVIYSQQSILKIDQKQVNLEAQELTLEILQQFALQILSKLIELNLTGQEMKDEAIQSLQIIEYFKGKLPAGTDFSKLDEILTEIEVFARGDNHLAEMKAIEAAKFCSKMQLGYILKDKRKKPIKRQSTLKVQQTQQEQQLPPSNMIKDHYKEMAENRLKEYKDEIKDNNLFSIIQSFIADNLGKTLEQILHLTKTYDFPYAEIKDFIQKDEDAALDIMDLYIIILD